MKTLVTGATGFVGSHIVRTLLAAGHRVRVLHRQSSRLNALSGLEVESAIGDILDADSLRAACQGCEWVFHAAAVADYWRSDPSKMFDANVLGTHLVLDAARKADVRRVVLTSSAAAVGLRHDGAPANEREPFNLLPAQFPYGYSKVLAERVALEAVAAGQDVVIVNPVVILGPGDLNQISGDFVIQIKRMGWRVPVPPGGVAVTDVRDVARWHLAAAERGRTGERYLLGTDNLPYHRWFALIADVVDAHAPAFPVPPAILPPLAWVLEKLRSIGIPTSVDPNQVRLSGQQVYFDPSKAWAELGKPQIDMRQSLQDTYRWYTENGYI